MAQALSDRESFSQARPCVLRRAAVGARECSPRQRTGPARLLLPEAHLVAVHQPASRSRCGAAALAPACWRAKPGSPGVIHLACPQMKGFDGASTRFDSGSHPESRISSLCNRGACRLRSRHLCRSPDVILLNRYSFGLLIRLQATARLPPVKALGGLAGSSVITVAPKPEDNHFGFILT
jgi:hypothetical protein